MAPDESQRNLNKTPVSTHAILHAMERALLHEHGLQLPFTLVAAELAAHDLAFYPDEPPDDPARTIALLRKLVRDGKLAGIAPARGTAGTCDLEEARILALKLRQARQGVEGRGILALDAEAKYGFPNPSIYRWHEGGWIRIAFIDAGNRFFNEGDLAFARTLADIIGHKAGKPLFPTRNPSGRPPKIK